MPAAPMHPFEGERLEALKELGILDTEPEELLDGLATLASRIAGTPIALVSLVDAQRQWFKAAIGLPVRETHRDQAFCAHAILQPEGPFVVEDAAKNPDFADNELVTGDPKIRFYAGFPLHGPRQLPMGTLCVIDRTPRQLTPEQVESLEILAQQVSADMNRRHTLHRLSKEAERRQATLARIVHDVKGPLLPYRYAHSVMVSDAKHTGTLEMIRQATDSLERLAEDLQRLVKGLDDARRIAVEPVDASGMLQRLVASHGSSSPISLTTPDILPVLADPSRLDQVLGNLIRNTQEHGAGETRITAEIGAGLVRIEFSNKAPDFSDAMAARVMEPGVSSSRSAGHWGLGLTICQELLENMGGRLVARADDGRAAFTVELPQGKPTLE